MSRGVNNVAMKMKMMVTLQPTSARCESDGTVVVSTPKQVARKVRRVRGLRVQLLWEEKGALHVPLK